MSFGSRSLPPPTADEARRIEACKQAGCIACLAEGYKLICGEAEYNHIVVGVRSGHRYGYCLGKWHHRGIVRGNHTQSTMADFYGPSLMQGSKAFHARYGSDQELLDRQDDLIDWPRVVIPTKRRKGKTDSPAKCKIGAIK